MNQYILIGTFLLSFVSALLAFLAFRSSRQANKLDFSVQLATIETIVKQIDTSVREEARSLREELRSILNAESVQSETRFSSFRKETLEGREQLEQSLKRSTDTFSEVQTKQLEKMNTTTKELATGLQTAQKDARDAQERSLLNVTNTIKELINSNITKQDQMREALGASLEQLRKDNEAKLEQMRLTVDEKLQGTLEKRIGESFQIVSDRLELVHKGLGEMQTLATGVGDLKRVLTNVKSRGGWGEVQLAMLLEDMLTKDQFVVNAKIRPNSSEIVEFAIRLPGKEPDVPVFLPIDSKFPHEDYDRLLQAQDKGNLEEIQTAASALERAIKTQAKTISEKYIHPPHSTDFAIMYLPTEGLFAEVIRIAGLVKDIQNKFRVVITGPTTLSALLNSLQMGFKTLAIEQRSSEVWQVLGEAKAEFRKYGDVWDKLKKQLDTAQNTVEEAGKRTRVIERKLKDVEVTTALPEAGGVVLLTAAPVVEDANDDD